MIGAPILIDGAPTAAGRPSPHLGEHTEEILRETLPRHQWAGASDRRVAPHEGKLRAESR
jgi:hypothetical protein